MYRAVIVNHMSDAISIQEVALTGNRGSRWIVKVNGQPVANYASLAAAERKAARL